MQTSEFISIDRYPKLRSWYDGTRSAAATDESLEDADLSEAERSLLLQLCHAMEGTSHTIIPTWCRQIEPFLDMQTNYMKGFEYLDRLLSKFDLDLSAFYGDLAYLAIALDQGEGFTEHCMKLRNCEVIGPIDFIAAWSALNSGNPQTCIAICADTMAMNAPIYTIHGQALLETGAVQEAVEVLQIAVKLDSKELLAWFQLAKAYSVMDRSEDAWNALKQCRTLAPDNIEIALFMAIEAQRCRRFLEEAALILVRLEPNFNGESSLYLTLLKLLSMNEDRDKFNLYLHKSTLDFQEPPKELAPLLKVLGQLGWHKETVDLIDRIIPTAS